MKKGLEKVPNLFLLLPRNILVGNIGGELSFIINGHQNVAIKSSMKNIIYAIFAAKKFKIRFSKYLLQV